MEGLKVSDADLVVYVHPSKASKVSEVVFRELSSLLFKFNEIFDGVVMAYDVVILSELAKILPGIHPYFGVRLQANLLLFHPKPNMLLEGKVVKIGQQSFHMIVLGFSSAIVSEENIRDEFKYKIKHGKEMFASKYHRKQKIKVGTIVRFMVKSFDEEMLHISGSLVPPHTGSVRWLDKNLEDCSQVESTTKKRRRNKSLKEMPELDEVKVDGETIPLNTDLKSKKSKRYSRDGS